MKKNYKKNMAANETKIVIDENDLQWLSHCQRWGCNLSQVKGEVIDCKQSIKALISKPDILLKDIDVEILTKITSSDIIDKFLRTENHKIVAQEGEVEGEITTEPTLSDDDDMVSEELAEVYLAQGLNDMAIETYRKLSLRNPEKSVYFAEIISKIEN
jgi:hypothetical protein